MQAEKLYTLKEPKERGLGSPATLWRRIAEGKLKAVTDGGKAKVRESERKRYVESLPEVTLRRPAGQHSL